MTIPGISGGMSPFMPIRQVNSEREPGIKAAEGKLPAQSPQAGNLFSAVTQALSAIGALETQNPTDTSTGSGRNATIVQAFGTFMNDLMGALHQQIQADGAPSTGSAARSGPPPDPSGPPPGMAQGSQSLVQQLGTTANSAASKSGDASVLQNSFQALLSAMGVSNSDASLQNFLSALSTHLAGASTSGNVVNTLA